jgi:MSHA biogenesis protein MshN
MLVALLVERRALDAARRELEEGLRQSPEQIGFASLLARLLVDQGDASGALEVLGRHAAYASASPQYRSFHAALLQRAGRHAEAVEEFRAALTISPVVGSWWMGLGISEQALGRRDAAASAFQNARTTGNLAPELVAFVEQRLRQLQ